MNKIKILYVFAEPFKSGGQEAFAINVYKNIDHSKFSIDLFTPYEFSNQNMKNILKDEDSIIHYDMNFDGKERKINYIIAINRFFKSMQKKYDIIHFNSGSSFALALGAKFAKKNTTAKIILHSHATGINSMKHSIINVLSKSNYKKADMFFGCSKSAGIFRFGNKIVNSKKFAVINNGIDINKFKFNKKIRENFRKKYNISNEMIVIGNVGRLSTEKNQVFLLDVFKKINQKNKKTILFIIGEGDEEERLKSYSKKINISNNVVFLGKKENIENYYQMFDTFVFPSLYEGLGISAIEAQTSGLICFVSEFIPNETMITKKIHKLCIKNGASFWANEILYTLRNSNKDRDNEYEVVKYSGFDITDSIKKLEKIYYNLNGGNLYE